MRCGAALTARVGPEERKVITALFCDLVAFTAQAERMDPEDVKATLRAYHTAVKDLVEGYGGTVEKFLGDGVIGVFGMPVAHEDDPERAVRVSLQTLDAISALNASHGFDLHVRIGVDTGEALVSTVPGEQIGGSIAGDIVNTCARLQTAASIDGILVGEATYRATSSVFVYEPVAPVSAKGKSEPLAVWRPLRARSRVVVDREGSSTPFVGRRTELATLQVAFEHAARMGGDGHHEPVVTMVTGEAGVGKTRLVREFAGYLERLPYLLRYRRGRCLPYGEGVRFWALGEVVKAEAGILDTDPPAETAAKLDVAVEALLIPATERAWVRQLLEPLVGLPGPAEAPPRDELFAAWRLFLASLAADRPAVVIFEDLHWADEALLAFISSTADELRGVPLQLVCVARSELEDRFPGWADGLSHRIDVALEPLDAAESDELLDVLLRDLPLPPATREALLERAGGNPLFAEEFVRMLRDTGATERPGGTIPVPGSLQALVVARLDALPADLKAVVHDASVVGKVFWPGAVAAVGDADRDEVEARLPFLLRRELITNHEPSSVEGEHEFSFRHDVTREVAYGQILKAERARKHRNAAAWLRAIGGERAADLAEEIAYHLDLALALSPQRDPALEVEAAEAMLLAGDRVDALDARAAARYHARALALLPPDDDRRVHALASAASAAWSTGAFADAEGWYREAIDASLAADDRRRAGELTAQLARSFVIQGRLAEADPLFDEAVRTLETLPPGPELARVAARISGQAFVAGDYDRSIAWAERALEVAADGEPVDAVALALQYRGSVRAERGEHEGLDDLREAIRLARSHELTEVLGAALGNLAYLTWFRDGPAAALQPAQDLQSYAAARGLAVSEMWGKAAEVESRLDLGDWDRVLTLAEELVAWDRGRGSSQLGMWGRFATAWVHVHRGELEPAAAALAEVEEHEQLLEYPEFRATASAIGAAIALERGDPAVALARVDDFDEAVREVPEVRLTYLPVVVRIAVAAGDLDAAGRQFPEDPGPPVERRRLSFETAVAVLDEAKGRHERALGSYRRLAEAWDAFGLRLEHGRCLLGEGRCLLALGRPEDARTALERARDALAPLRARPLLAEIEDRLAYAADSIDAS
jgi:class 3 adenylate cyclase/tetratricopeptide (TPR) repeat protein